MKVNIAIPLDSAGRMAEAALEGLAEMATNEFAQGGLPYLYKSGVRYQRERPGHEEWLVPTQVLAGGVGDCEDLAAYRVGELRATGADPGARVVIVKTGPRTLHAVVRRSDGTLEDPSRALGMGQREHGSLAPALVAGVERGHSWVESAWKTPSGVLMTSPTLAEALDTRVAGVEVGFVDTLLRAAGGAVNAVVPGLLSAPQPQQAIQRSMSDPGAVMRSMPGVAQGVRAAMVEAPGASAEDVLRIAASMARIVKTEGQRVAREQRSKDRAADRWRR